jgi:hypothetical protein
MAISPLNHNILTGSHVRLANEIQSVKKRPDFLNSTCGVNYIPLLYNLLVERQPKDTYLV